MEIKKSLKSLDVRISKMASELGISRPTLDSYIENYENGQPIPNGSYQRIFDYLFSNENMNSIEFAQKFDYVKRVMLKDVEAGCRQDKNEQRMSLLSEKMRVAIDAGAISKPLLEFITLFYENQNVNLVKSLYMYFNYSNGFEDMTKEEISEADKAFISQLALLFDSYNANSLAFDEDRYNAVLEKNQRMLEAKQTKVKDSDIVDYIKKNMQDAGNIDFDILKQMIESRG